MATDVNSYVELNLELDEQTLVDEAIVEIQQDWTNWDPDDGDFEVAILEKCANIAAALSLIANQMPPAALMTFGTKSYGIAPGTGAPAQTTVTLEMVDDIGYTVTAGMRLEIDGYAFNLVEDTIVPNGETEVTGVLVYCAVNTADANNLTGAVTAPLSLPSYVTAITVETPTADGEDPQTNQQFLDTFSADLQLRAKTIVNTRDFEIEALNFSPDIGRAQAVGNTAREVQVTVATPQGGVVPSDVKTALAAHYDTFALVNTTFTIIDAQYSTIDITWAAKKVPSTAYDTDAVKAQVNALLTTQMNPTVFGAPVQGDASTGQSGWIEDPTVYVNDIIALIKSVPGILHVTSVEINGVAADFTMPGTTPLPEPGAMTGTLTT